MTKLDLIQALMEIRRSVIMNTGEMEPNMNIQITPEVANYIKAEATTEDIARGKLDPFRHTIYGFPVEVSLLPDSMDFRIVTVRYEGLLTKEEEQL